MRRIIAVAVCALMVGCSAEREPMEAGETESALTSCGLGEACGMLVCGCAPAHSKCSSSRGGTCVCAPGYVPDGFGGCVLCCGEGCQVTCPDPLRGGVAICTPLGGCGIQCDPGRNLCNGSCLLDSPTSCGPSCQACPGPASGNGSATCVAGACDVVCDRGYVKSGGDCLPCPSGYADCDGDPLNACEVNVRTPSYNCWTCGNYCDLFEAVSLCGTNGSCEIQHCNATWSNFDGMHSNGCECNEAWETCETP